MANIDEPDDTPVVPRDIFIPLSSLINNPRFQQNQVARKQKQKQLLEKTQTRLSQLMQQMIRMRENVNKRASDNDALEEFMTRSLASMITRGFSLSPFPGRVTSTTTTTSSPPEEDTGRICNAIRGRDRACCNAAVRCFEDTQGTIDDLQNQPDGSFSLMSACRKVSEELKKDKICVKQSLSRCNGQGRAMLQSRFDNRVDNLYDQFYKQCRLNPVPTTTTQAIPTVRPVPGSSTAGTVTGPSVGTTSKHNNHDGHWHGHGDEYHKNGASSGSGSGAILAGAITGGVILIIVLLVAAVLWCKNRRDDRNGSDSSGSMGVFFQKRPNAFSTERPSGDNNNKPGVSRQDSSIYAEIDEGMVNPNYKPPVPPDTSYLNPIPDTNPELPLPRAASVPAITTRGQLSYGAILAANSESGSNKNLHYHSAAVPQPNHLQNKSRGKSFDTGYDATLISPPSLLMRNDAARQDNSYVISDPATSLELDDYEEPLSASSSQQYAQLDQNEPPKEFAPEVPSPNKTKGPQQHKHSAVKVLPSIPLVSGSPSGRATTAAEASTPVAKPRRKKGATNENENSSNENVNTAQTNDATKQTSLGNIKLSDKNMNRDSLASNSSAKSSHHYFVLEPETELPDYENSVSSPKLV